MTAVLVLQGPNLNLVGTREPEIYGHESLDEIHAGIAARAAELGLEVDFFQSNHEGALIDRLHQRDFDVAIVNAGGLTHTSVALRDALLGDPAAVRRGPPVRPVDARAVPPGQLPPRHRARVDRRARGRAATTSRSTSIAARFGAAVEARMAERHADETPELRRLRQRIDALDRRIVGLLNERAELAREVGRAKAAAGRRAIRDAEREREVLLRVTMANAGPAAAGRPARDLPPADGGDAGARGARPRRRGEAPTTLRLTDGPPGPAARRDPLRAGADRATSTSATSRTRSASGAWPRATGGACSCGSRTTTGSAAGPSSTPRCSRTSTGSGSSPTPAPFASRTTGRCTRRRSSASGIAGSSTPATAPARRSRRGRGGTGGRGRAAAARAAAVERALAEPAGPACGSRSGRRGDVGRPAAWAATRRRRADGDLPIRDRHGNWTYGFCVVVDDLRQEHRSRRPRRGPARRDAAPDPARPAARPRPPAGLRPPPADPQARGREAVEGRRRHRRPRAPGARPRSRRGARRGGGGRRADRRGPTPRPRWPGRALRLRPAIRASGDSEAARDRSCERAASGPRPFGRARTG